VTDSDPAVVSTARLLVRLPREGDRDRFLELFRNEDFMAFYPGVLTVEEAGVRFDHMVAVCQAVPFGKQPVVELSSGLVVGYTGVDYIDLEGRTWLEWGYRLVPECRGLGYATEASRALLARARQAYAGELLAIIAPENLASQNVCRKLGFTFWKQAPVEGEIRNLYTLPAGEPGPLFRRGPRGFEEAPERGQQRVEVLAGVECDDGGAVAGAKRRHRSREDADYLVHPGLEFAEWIGRFGSEPAPKDVVVGRDDRCRHELGAQRGRLGLIAHPIRDELTEQPLIARHARDLPVPQGGHRAGERVTAAREVAFLQVVQQDESDRIGDGGQRGVMRGGMQSVLHETEEPVMVGEDDVFFRAVVAEEGRPPQGRPVGDGVHGGLLIAPLVEQVKRGLREPVPR
jgi:RimJ/RimL family protein N-acetyltransferase